MYYLGVDVGSVSTDIVLLDKERQVVEQLYLRTRGRPIDAVQQGFRLLKNKYSRDEIVAAGTTGSGRAIAAVLIGADAARNEITAHARAAVEVAPDTATIIEIGGQDSKIILLRSGVVVDFAMNTVCAAGTGSFLDRQAERLEIPIERFGDYALHSKSPVRIAGRCAVFAESDMIHKQQLGCNHTDIIRGLCEALVRNYLNNIAKGKEVRSKILFQGGVAANIGMKAAFESILQTQVHIPEHYNMMGAIGAALIAAEAVKAKGRTSFKGFELADREYSTGNFECNDCSNRCEVSRIMENLEQLGCFGDRCGKWNAVGRI